MDWPCISLNETRDLRNPPFTMLHKRQYWGSLFFGKNKVSICYKNNFMKTRAWNSTKTFYEQSKANIFWKIKTAYLFCSKNLKNLPESVENPLLRSSSNCLHCLRWFRWKAVLFHQIVIRINNGTPLSNTGNCLWDFLKNKNRLIHFSPMSHFYTPWKRQKIFGFLAFSGGIKMWHWTKMG